MPDPELPEGFAFEEEEPLPEGFAVEETTPLERGVESISDGYRETGRRVHELPGFDFSIDPTGENAPRERQIGQSTEIREVEKDPTYAARRQAAMTSQIERERRGETDTPRPWTRAHGEMLFGTELGGRDFASGEGAERFVDRIGDVAAGRTGLDLPNPVGRGYVPVLNRDARRRIEPSGLLDLLIPTANTDEPIVGSDLRPLSGVIGATDAATFGFFDEMAGGLSNGTPTQRDRVRDRHRATSERAEEQAPGTYALGEVAGSIPQMAAPMGGTNALARMGIAGGVGLGSGTLRGAGDSEAQDMGGLASDAVRGGLTEGLLASGTQGVGDAAGPALRRLARGIQNRIPGMQQQATQSALEARGIWGRGPLEAARERPGGAEALVRELDAIQAPNNPRLMPDFIDRMLAEEGPRVGRIAGEIDEAAGNGAVDLGRVADDLESLAEGEGRNFLTGDRPAEALQARARAIRELPTTDFGGTPDDAPRAGFVESHAQRRALDNQINWNNPDEEVASLMGQRQAIRRSLSDAMQGAADAVGRGPEWADANQRYALASELNDIGRGVERNNVGGGYGGANTRAEGFSRLLHGSGAMERLRGAGEMIAGPAAMQEIRYSWPAMNRRRLEATIPVLRTMSPGLQRAAQTLEAAMRRGQTALAAAHYTLMRSDHEYRQAMEAMQNEEQE